MDVSEFQARLLKLIKDEKFVALGEIGLDRVCAIDFDLQRKSFSYQLELATDLEIKTVIIHCVRALNEILELTKKSSYKGTLVFHDANFSLNDCQRLIDQGHYLSFGSNLMRENSKANEVFSKLDINHIFLETDDSNLAIEDVYKYAAAKFGVLPDLLCARVLKNFQKLFPTLIKD